MGRFLNILLLALVLASPARANGLAVQVTSLSDLNLGSWGIGDPAVAGHIDVCIAAIGTLPLSNYAITATGDSGFQLTSGSNHIPYTLAWEDTGSGNLGTSPGTAMNNGVLLDQRTNAYLINPPLCAVGGPTARLHIAITQAAMTAALAGTYSGTVTLLVAGP